MINHVYTRILSDHSMGYLMNHIKSQEKEQDKKIKGFIWCKHKTSGG